MRFAQDSTSGINVIRAYGNGELRVNDDIYRGTVMLSADSVAAQPAIKNFDDLGAWDASLILALAPELILLGTGTRQIFPAASFGAQFIRIGIGFEVMGTGAACRTFNVLVGELRKVAALLLM
jgi:uncharacterized protein